MIGREIFNALYGAFLLMRFAAAGCNYFNSTVAGFWRSFGAAVIALPLFLGVVYVHTWAGEGVVSFDVRQSIFRYGTGWLVYPLVALLLVKILDRMENYVAYIITNNWFGVPQWLLVGLVNSVGQASGSELSNLISICLLLLLVYYDFFIARVVLDLTPGRAALVVFIGVLSGMVLDTLILDA